MIIERFRGSSGSRSLGRRDGWLLLALALLLLWLAPVLARAQAPDTLVLHWTAPADAPGSVRVTRYDVRWSGAQITAANFGSATALVPPVPAAPGAPESLVVRGLPAGQPAWFAVKSVDAAGNWSAISNIVRWSGVYDTSPPATPAGIASTAQADGKAVTLTWRANAEPDLAGYNVYRSTASDGPWTRVNPVRVVETSFTDNALPAGVLKLWYQISAVDQSGNESARASAGVVTIPGALGASPIAWRLAPAYPNPAHLGDVVHVPIEVPPAAGSARLEILDGAGQVVRRFDLGAGSIGFAQVDWDGTNERGARCAPGVYRAWLVATGTRQFSRIAWVP